MKTIAVIGGGASGLMAAITAAQALREYQADCDAQVVLYEADPERVGRSILTTGNGRCNFSNAQMDADVYHNADFVRVAYDALPPQDIWQKFERLGLVWREEAEGRMYPFANKASSVLDVLRAEIARLGVRVQYGKQLTKISAEQDCSIHHLWFDDGSIEHVRALVLAMGGRSVAALQLPGEAVVLKPRLVLGPLQVNDAGKKLTRQLNNIRVRCAVSLKRGKEILATEQGELLFRDYGVSGVCVFNLSRMAEPGDSVVINFVSGITGGNKSWLLERFHMMQNAFVSSGSNQVTFDDLLRGVLLPQVAKVLVGEFGFKLEDACDDKSVGMVSCMLEKFKLQITGVGDARQCQVTRGGLDVAQFNPSTCELQSLPGFFAAGEAIDVDGPCGGYNLHWAWASGTLAGRAAVQRALGVSAEDTHA